MLKSNCNLFCDCLDRLIATLESLLNAGANIHHQLPFGANAMNFAKLLKNGLAVEWLALKKVKLQKLPPLAD